MLKFRLVPAMQRASQILGQISAASNKSKAADPILDNEQIICAAWPRAVGRKIAQHTRAAKLVRNCLIVEVEDAMWQRNLFLLSRQIVANLESALGPGVVTFVEFRILPPRREPQRAAAASKSATLPFDESDNIADPGLRRLYRADRLKELA
jgi:predicted nucleic acid-binding Zn ribbon protein